MTLQAEPRTGLRPGELVAGIYRVESKVGEGASGEVWSAINTQNGIKVALKALFSTMTADEEVVARFRREAFFLARAKSDYVAKIYEFINDPATGMVLVMEFVEGESLAQIFDRRILSVEESIAVAIDILSGVIDLHAARIIHRDLKPANILMQPQPDGRLRAVICDFSLSRLASGPRREGSMATSLTELTRGDVALGTVRYMAPEQVLNSRQATERSDLYAVGAILYRGLAGVHAFSEYQTIRQVARAKVTGESRPLQTGRTDPVARGLEALVAKALRRRPAERYQDGATMRAALVELAGLIEVSAERDTQTMLAARDSSHPGAILKADARRSRETSSGGPSSESSLGLRLSASGAAAAPTTPSLLENEPSVAVRFDSAAAPAPTRSKGFPLAMILGVVVVIFGAGIAAGRLWAVQAVDAGPVPAGSVRPEGPAVADRTVPSAPAVTPSSVATPAPAADPVKVLALDAAVATADLDARPGAVVPEPAPPPTSNSTALEPKVAEAPHHHHTAPVDSAAASASAPAPAASGTDSTPPVAEAGAPGPKKGPPPLAHNPGDDDFENPYDEHTAAPSPAKSATPKPKSDAPAAGDGGLPVEVK